MRAEKKAAWYNHAYESHEKYSRHYTMSPYRVLWGFALALFPPQKRSIVDLGCGSGQFAELLKDNGYDDYVGVDFSEKAILIARKKFMVQNGFEFIVGDLNDCEIPDGEIYCLIEILEHLNHDRELLERIPKWGFVVATVPDFYSEAHVRRFATEDSVRSRYGKIVEIKDMMRIGRHYIFSGIR